MNQSDRDYIEAAYADALKMLYGRLFQGYVAGDPAGADDNFIRSAGFAAATRDRALVLLAQVAAESQDTK